MARKGNMVDIEIKSTFLQETMLVKMYEPESFDPIYETNICYMQDGDDYFQMGRIATLSDKLHDSYDIVNTYFIGIHYKDRKDRLKKYHPEGEQHGAYVKFLLEEVLSTVEDLIPLNPLGIKRALIGDSLAGTFALTTSLTYPDLFHKAILQSPLVDDVVMEIVTGSSNKSLEIYHSIGLQENSVATTELGDLDFVVPNQQLQGILMDRFPQYTYQEIPKGNHTWKYWQNEMEEVLVHMFS